MVERAIVAAGVPRTFGATTPREDAIGLLQLAAEVEHELLVAYLYAAASVDGSAGTESRTAKRALTTIAIQEMGHLVAVQNLLLAIGGRESHHFGRDVLRAMSDRNPLPLVLEPVRHASLAKYVTIESPDHFDDPATEQRAEALRQEAEADAQFTPHPVIALYAAIYWIFQPTDDPFGAFTLDPAHFESGWHLKPEDFAAAADIDRFASTSAEWAGFPGLTITAVHNAGDGCALLNDVMVQGEGAAGSPGDSHFAKFLAVLTAFEAGKLTVVPLPRTPRVADQPASEDARATTIAHPYSERWARLFNLRYTHLVLTIAHTLFLPADDPDRGTLSNVALTMMRPALSALIQQITRLPLDAAGTGKAGPPFGLLDDTLPASDGEFWSHHRAAVAAITEQVAAIEASAEFAADGSGRLVLQQHANVDQPLIDLLQLHEASPQMKFAIYPPIGLARIGNSPDGFFIGAERRGSLGTEIQADGSEREVTNFKDAMFRMKPQAARFHIFEIPDGQPPRPAQLPAGATVRWSVRMVNKKDAIQRPGGPPDVATKPLLANGRENRVIDSGVRQIAGASAAPVTLSGTYVQTSVRLGELRTDASQRLLVIGAEGKSASPTNASIGGSFYNNRDWFDDLGDGPVTADVVLADGTVVSCTPAWVAVGPPDFAPGCQGVVTLYDVILQVALSNNQTTLPARPSFVDHIQPMLERAHRLRFVNNGAMWPLISDNVAALGDPSPAQQQLRSDNAALVRSSEDQLHDFALREWQNTYLDQWVAGNFDPGPATVDPAAALTRVVLDGSVGQGFFPGIEAGIIVTGAQFYAQPFDFRFDHAALDPGDVTALMALPWQADFLKCNGSWWPAQRPDVAPQANGQRPPWLRPNMNHKRLVADVMKLGVIMPGTDATGHEAFVEAGRDPQLGT